ncbi:MAG: tyrosine-type recombinase/integrase [Nocardioidaceae bacterium]
MASPAQIEAILTEVTRTRPELAAFFGCLYYAALRPEEAVALTVGCCHLPPSGWGTLTLTAAAPRSGTTWTGNGTPHERRGLKLRPHGAVRTVPIPPQLVTLLLQHLRAHGKASDGRLFASPRGGPLHESLYGRVWHTARAAALGPSLAATPLVRRPYDLRHSALSLWLGCGAPPAEIAVRAGHSVHVLLAVYAHCVPGHDQLANSKIESGLGSGSRPTTRNGPPPAQKTPAHRQLSPTAMRPCTAVTNGTQRDPAALRRHISRVATCANTSPKEADLNIPARDRPTRETRPAGR